MKYPFELEQRKKQIVSKAVHCNRCLSKYNLTVDHIIPIEILMSMGMNLLETFKEENFQILCGKCNSLKGNRLDFSNPKTKELLIKYLNETNL